MTFNLDANRLQNDMLNCILNGISNGMLNGMLYIEIKYVIIIKVYYKNIGVNYGFRYYL